MSVLVVFAKDPAPGRSKSRLARTIGADAASAIATAMLTDLRDTLSPLDDVRVCIAAAADDESSRRSFDELLPGFDRELQRGVSLGDRLRNSVTDWFDRGARPVIIIGTDCPLLDASVIEMALAMLGSRDVVLGPASDGGYYLVGLSSPEVLERTALFDGIDWDGPSVLHQTASRLRESGASLGLLPQLSDIDEAADLRPVLGQLEAAAIAGSAHGTATRNALADLLSEPATPPPFEHIHLPYLDPIDCPCGQARRGFGEASDLPATVHLTQISRDAQPHRHARQREVYVILEAGPNARVELDGQRRPVRPRDAILIRPGCVHRAIGEMTVLVICIPKFDPADEEVVGEGLTEEG